MEINESRGGEGGGQELNIPAEKHSQGGGEGGRKEEGRKEGMFWKMSNKTLQVCTVDLPLAPVVFIRRWLVVMAMRALKPRRHSHRL